MTDETTSSLTGSYQVLEQAVKSGDLSLMDYLLTKTPKSIVPTIIQQMKPSLISPFLRTFTNQIQRNPKSLGASLIWLENFVDVWRNDISASAEYQRRIRDLQKILKDRTQQIGMFIEADALSYFVSRENNGQGIGLPTNDLQVQTLSED